MRTCIFISKPLINGIKLCKDDCPTSLTKKIQMVYILYFESIGSLIHSIIFKRLGLSYNISLSSNIFINWDLSLDLSIEKVFN